MANADSSRKNAAKLAAGVVFTSQSTNPIPSGSAGFWADSTDSALKIVNMDGTTYAVGAGGRTYKEACRLATAGALGAGSYSAGVFTQTSAAVEQIDSTTVAVGDRILVKNQSTGSQNGIYTITTVGTVSVKQVLTRAYDFDASGQITSGCLVPISEGTANADSVFMLTTNAPITLDTTSLSFNLEPVSITYGTLGQLAATGVSDVGAAGVSSNVARIDHVHPIAGDVTMLKEVDHVTKTTASTTAATAGGAQTLAGGAGSTSGAGGAANLTGGIGGVTGAGGAAAVAGGAGGATSGVGGAASMIGGIGTAGNSAGGTATVAGGAGQGSAIGGVAAIAGGAGGATGAGAAASLKGGAGGATSGTGGAVAIAGGAGTNGNATGGAVDIQGGAKNGSGADGAITIGTSAGAVTIGKSGNIETHNGLQASAASANVIADPGTGVAIPVTASGYVPIVTAGAETNTLAIPTFRGQRLTLTLDTRVGGNRVVTSAQRINQAANTIMTFDTAADTIELVGITVAGVLRWQVAFNEGVTLS